MSKQQEENAAPRRLPGLRIVIIGVSIAVLVFLGLMGTKIYQQAANQAQRNPVTAVYAPDGKTLAVAVGEDTRLYNAAGFSPLRALSKAKGGTDYATVFSADSQILAVNRGLWQSADGARLRSLDVYDVFQLAFSPDGTQLATFALSGVDVWKLQDGSRVTHINTSAGCACQAGLSFMADGKLVTYGNAAITTWNAATGAQLAQWKLQPPINAVSLAVDGSALAVGSGAKVDLYSVADGKLIGSFTDIPATVSLVALAWDGKSVAAAWGSISSASGAAVWSVADGKRSNLFQLPGRPASLAISPDGKQLAAGSYAGSVTVWDVNSGAKLSTIDFTDWQGLWASAARENVPFLNQQP